MSTYPNFRPKKAYKFVHNADECINTTIKGKSFQSPEGLLELKSDGTLHIYGSCLNGYAWDGCSPKFEFLDLLIGTPDGRLDRFTKKPITYFASMLHDALYQFKAEIPISRKTADLLFFIILRETGFKWAWLYYLMVRLAGPLYGKWKTKESVRSLRIIKASWLEQAYLNPDDFWILPEPC